MIGMFAVRACRPLVHARLIGRSAPVDVVSADIDSHELHRALVGSQKCFRIPQLVPCRVGVTEATVDHSGRGVSGAAQVHEL
jgi:hypothetical protein